MSFSYKNAYPYSLESLLEAGFTSRMAREFLSILERERTSHLFDTDYLEWAHAHGFCAESAYAYGLNESNYEAYLSDFDYWRLWPLNSWQRIWINDKLTLNALLCDSELSKYMPDYYYYSRPDQDILPLQGANHKSGVEGLIETLTNVKAIACKPCNGSEASGFHRLTYTSGLGFKLDGSLCTEEDIHTFVKENPNYLFTEFLRPNDSFGAINPLIHTMRVLVINPTGVDPQITMSYLRFATTDGSTGNGANYAQPLDQQTYSYNTFADLHNNWFGNGKIVYANKVIDAPEHPVSQVRAEGPIPYAEEIKDMLTRIALKVNACEYLGFDACITPDGPKIMEINSHSGVKYLQLFSPVYEDKVLGEYFQQKLHGIDSLSERAKEARHAINR